MQMCSWICCSILVRQKKQNQDVPLAHKLWAGLPKDWFVPIFWPHWKMWSSSVLWMHLDLDVLLICNFHWARSYEFRTAQEAGQIYRAGMLFLQQHLALTKICARPGLCPVMFEGIGRFLRPLQAKVAYVDSEAKGACQRLIWFEYCQVSTETGPILDTYFRSKVFHHLLRQTQTFRALDCILICTYSICPWRFGLLHLAISGMNPRFFHTFHDEDSMGWAKCVAKKVSRRTLESAILKCANLRLALLRWRTSQLNNQSRRRWCAKKGAWICNIVLMGKFILIHLIF